VGQSAETAPDPLTGFCQRLRRLQRASGITQRDLARVVRVSEQQMSDTLNGKIVRLPPWPRVHAMVDACLDRAAADARPLPPDLADPGTWRSRYLDLEQDLDASARTPDRYRVERVPAVELVLRNGFLLTPAGHVPRVGEVDANFLGVHPAIQVAQQPAGTLPPYVRRDLDSELDELLHCGGLILICGRSAAGKTRTAFEAIQRGLAEHELLVPRNAGALRALAGSGTTLRMTVIWLNDLDRFLASGEVDQQLVTRLCPAGHSDVVIIATLRSQAMLDLTTAAGPAERSLAHAVGEVLALAVTRTLDRELSDAERERADALRHDARIAEALYHARETGFAEFLCAGPAILDRWRHGRDADEGAALVGAALTSAAVHCRRAGCEAPLPRTVLAELYADYLDSRDAHRPGGPSVDDGLVWATEPVRGASSCLVPHPGDRYRAFDYLADSPEQVADIGPVPDSVWTVLLNRLEPQELNLVSLAARRTGREDIFRQMQVRWAGSMDDPAAWCLTGSFLLFDGPGDRFRERAADAEPWLVRAANAGHAVAARRLVTLFDILGDAEAAERWARRGAEIGDGESMVRLGEFCEERSELTEAGRWYEKAVQSGPVEGKREPLGPNVPVELGPYEHRLSWIRGDYVEESCAPLNAIAHLGMLRAGQGDFAEAERLLRRAASYGQMNDLLALAHFLLDRGNAQDLSDWCAQAARAGRFDAVMRLGEELARSGSTLLAQRVFSCAADAWRTEAGAYLGQLAHSGGDAEAEAEGEPYPHGAAEAILLSLEAVAAADGTGLCGPVLGVMSMLSSRGMSRELLYVAGSEGLLSKDAVLPQAVDQVICRLADASLLTCAGDGSVVTAHRLVMRVIRERLAHEGSLTAVGTRACDVLRAVARTLADPWENRPLAWDIAQHAIALNDHLAPGLGDEGGPLAESMLNLCGWAFLCLLKLGDSVQALKFGERLVAGSERVLGHTHPDTLRVRNDLASAYLEAGKAGEAVPLLERTLADGERARGKTHPQTLTARSNLAAAYLHAERAQEAVALLERTLADRTRMLGKSHPDTLTTCGNLAAAYAEAERVTDAVALLERSLPDSTRVLGKAHPTTLNLRANLASAFRRAGRAGEAIPLLEQTLADLEHVLGETHPHTLTGRNNLARLYREAGRLDEALPLYERVLRETERILGRDHPTTNVVREGFAAAKQEAEEPERRPPG
jgi:tetratricopeptide (TPR) repeat protein/transcriptional regulator with XRE-family HTH domain